MTRLYTVAMGERKPVILKVLAPSFLSGLVSAIFAVSVIAVVLTPFLYEGSGYFAQYGEAIRVYEGTWQEIYSKISSQLNSSELVANVVIFCTWAAVGFAVYFLILSLLSWFIDTVTFANLLGFKNSDKKTIIIQAFEQFALRTFGLICLVLFLVFAFQVLMPAVLVLLAASISSTPVFGALYIIAAVVFLTAAFHVVVVLLRTIFLRVRLISWMYDTSDL